MPERPRLIALTGRSGAGKDSVAATLVRHLNYRSVAFADALRAEVAATWRIDARMLQDAATKEWPIPALAVGNCGAPSFVRWLAAQGCDTTEARSPRWLMQRWGDHQRASEPDHYALIVRRWLGRQLGTGWKRLVVTDLRFANEYVHLDQVEPRGRLRVVRVHRPDLAPLPAGAHASETDLADLRPDIDLVNEGSLADLVQSVLRMEGELYADQ